MKLCRDLNLNPETYSVSIPLGATINMAGAAITINTLTLAAVHTLGIQVDFSTAFVSSIVAAVSACAVHPELQAALFCWFPLLVAPLAFLMI